MRTVRLFVVGLFAMLIGSTALAAACDGFTDVDSANSTYCSAVTYLKDKGITLGCTGTAYCPNDYVTRLQMALFLQRFGRGGPNNVLGDFSDAIGGGDNNTTADFGDSGGAFAAVAGGAGNSAIGYASAVAGGLGNSSSGYASVAAGGANNVASGTFSFAAGYYAVADRDRCAVFSLWNNTHGIGCLNASGIFRVGGEHGMSVDYYTERADGGGTRYVGIGDLNANQTITAWNGAYLSDAGVWTSVSDRAVKHNFTQINTADVLARVVAIPIDRWEYRVEHDITHIGPVAQDFYAAFKTGADDKTITSIDESGVALAAIQGLNAKVDARDAIIEVLSHELAEIKAQLATMAAAH